MADHVRLPRRSSVDSKARGCGDDGEAAEAVMQVDKVVCDRTWERADDGFQDVRVAGKVVAS